ncbi:DUF1905 domain-containing protein [Microbacterium sp. W1N]|uniref:DUF1905 domain-containing protein n=1 Tax=Microbacterium festucae TaxID=2977531 RepID=UPI0021BF2684|nr:DUF1905 domain-containing protein [Microbacterium festucae]MCT9821609.1 DUF1905 domain-containing protein [Microbacterium festucae]
MIVEFTGEVYRWAARTQDWFFVALPPDASEMIREIPRMPRGFGAVRVDATIGRSGFRTSIFPDAERGAYVLPLKRTVRDAEDIAEGSEVSVTLHVLDG